MTQRFELRYKELLDQKIDFYAALGNRDDLNERLYKPFNLGGKKYYTFKKNNVRFFALDSNYMNQTHLDWLEKEFAASGSGWKIAFFHHPLYSTGGTHGPSLDLRKRLEPLFIKYDVSVVLAGYEHFYERIKPRSGIAYLISGAGVQLRNGDIHQTEPLRSGPLVHADGSGRSRAVFPGDQPHRKTVDKGTITQLKTHPGKEVVESPGAPTKNQPPPPPK